LAGIGNRFGTLEKSKMWGKGKKRFGGGGGSEPAAKRQAAGDEGPSESADDGTVVAEVRVSCSVTIQIHVANAKP
jgi:hypothetical protein